MSEVDDLRARVSALENENASLRSGRTRRVSVRAIVSGILLVIAVVLAPVAAVGTWARLQLVDTEQFVATFAPLASDPAVQDFVADQVIVAINEQVDVESIVGDVFDGIRDLDLDPRAETALGILEVPATQGITSLIDGVVHDLVSSEQFATVWTEALRFTHQRAVAVIQNDPTVAIQLGDDGVIAVDLGIVIERVKETLAERGIGIADLIPVVDKTIPIAQADALVLVRTVYQLAVTTGFWLPWVVLGLIVVGVLLAQRRSRAVFWTSAGFALAFMLVAAGVGIGRTVFIHAVSPGIMPVGAATALYSQITELLQGTVVALALVGVIAAIWAWIGGTSTSAMRTRTIVTDGFASVRNVWERRGVNTGRFGLAVERFRAPILLVGIAVGVLILIANRPIGFGSVVGVAGGLLVLVVLIELLRRPSEEATEPSVPDSAVEEGENRERTVV